MASVTLTISDGAQLDRVKAAFVGLYPIPPVSESDPTPQFTENQWSKELLRRFVVQTVQRWEQRSAMNVAKNNISPDDTIAS